MRGRNFADRALVMTTLDKIAEERGPVVMVIQGGATGADALADDWACRRGIKSVAFKADWMTHGKGAGPIRNQRMLDAGQPDLVVAFEGGRGTADMITRTKRAGIEILEPRRAARAVSAPNAGLPAL